MNKFRIVERKRTFAPPGGAQPNGDAHMSAPDEYTPLLGRGSMPGRSDTILIGSP